MMRLTLIGCVVLAAGLAAGLSLVLAADEKSKTAEKKPGEKAAKVEETVEVEFQDLKLKVPKSWKSQEVSSNMRLGQFSVAPTEGDKEPAEVIVFPPFGGTRAANVERWIGMFEAEGREQKLTQGKCEQGEYVLAELSGTYKKPKGPPIQRKTEPAPGYRMLSAIIATKENGNYFVRIVGPDKTVTSVREAFRASFGAQAEEEEKEFSLKDAE